VRATQATSWGGGRSAVEKTHNCVGSCPTGFLHELAPRVIYRSGALSFYHWLRNRQVLTVVTFHRVLPRGDPRWETALIPWTLADDTFAQCLALFQRHYRLVTLPDVKEALEGTRALPSWSLLITLDDGFADNIEYALPLLRNNGAFATVFVTSDLIGHGERLWTEDLPWAFMAGQLRQRQLALLHRLLIGESACDPDDPQLIWNLVRRGPKLEEGKVQAALSSLEIDLPRTNHPHQMLTRDEIASLVTSGNSLGAHGKTHTALPLSSDIAAKLRCPRAVLSDRGGPWSPFRLCGVVSARSIHL
jgi:peptidoglycan/xylan/chitin deacetylase (PgdA/CDA1 family)